MRAVRSTLGVWIGLCAPLLGCGVTFGGMPTATFTNTGNDTAARFFHRASLLADGRAMMTGGMMLQIFPPSLISLSSVSFYDPVTGIFSATFMPTGGGGATTPAMATARSSHTQTTMADGRVLITGGFIGASGTNQGTPTASVEIFDPVTGTMSAGPAMSTPRADHRAALLSDGRVLVAGGSSWQLFDPVSGTWSAAVNLARTRNAHAAVRLDGFDGPGIDAVLLVAGSGSGSTTMEIVHPSSGTSTLMGSTLMIGVDDVAAASLDGGDVLIVGGQDLSNGNTIGLSYRFTPATDTLANVPSPPSRAAGIADHAIVSFGRYAAIFGGEQQVSGTDTELNYSAVFDSAIDDWVYTATMNHVHDDFPAVALNDGLVLLVGGGIPFFGNEAPSNTAELFTLLAVPLGDVNGDDLVTASDILPFVDVVLEPAGATARELCAADTNVDQVVDGLDVQEFSVILTGMP